MSDMRGGESMFMLVSFLIMGACGPDAPHEENPPGVLEYEMPIGKFFRLDRRVDIVGADPMNDLSGCGVLTDRAYGELSGALGKLDAEANYPIPDCELGPESSVHLEGFASSPFSCSWYCCAEELLPIAIVYFAVGSNLYDQGPNIDGESYVALEPDMPCPD